MKFDELNTPEELFSFINKNIQYGYKGKNNNKIYYFENPEFNKDWLDEYAIQTPEMTLKNKLAVCWDYVELARYWFEKNNYIVKTIFIAFFKPKEKNYFTHTFLIYKEKSKWIIFENSFDGIENFKEYKTVKDAIKDVIKAHNDYFKTNFFTKVKEYKKPKFGIDPLEFCDYCLKK